MARQLQSDKVLFGAVVGLVLFGALMVFSASAVMAADRYNNGNYFLLRQLAWAGVGLIAVAILMHTDYRRLASPLVVFPALALEFIFSWSSCSLTAATIPIDGFTWGWQAFSLRSLPRLF